MRPEGGVVHHLVMEKVRLLDYGPCLWGAVLQLVLKRYDVPSGLMNASHQR